MRRVAFVLAMMAFGACGGRSIGVGPTDAGKPDSVVLVTDGAAQDLDAAGDVACPNGYHQCPLGCAGALVCFDADAKCPLPPSCTPPPLLDATSFEAGEDGADACAPIGGDCSTLPCCPGNFTHYCISQGPTRPPTCVFELSK